MAPARDRPTTRATRSTSSRGSPSRSAHPRLAGSPDASDRVRKTRDFAESKARARAYKETLRTRAPAPRTPAPAAPAAAPGSRERAREFALQAGWLTESAIARADGDGDDDDDDGDAAPPPPSASALASELMFPGAAKTPTRARPPPPAPAASGRRGAEGVLLALGVALAAALAKWLYDAYVAAKASTLTLAREAGAGLAALARDPRYVAAAASGALVCAAGWVAFARAADRSALAEQLYRDAIAALEAAVDDPRADARVPADHLRDALVRARCPLAGARRDLATGAWRLVQASLESDARIRSVMLQVAGKRMKHYEYVAAIRASPARAPASL